jgi:hypothetical protein
VTKTLACLAVAPGYLNSPVGSALYTYMPPPLAGAYLNSAGNANTMTVGGTLQFSAFCYYTGTPAVNNCSNPDPYGYAVTQWVSSNPAVLTIGAVGSATPGLVTATGAGTAFVQAQVGSLNSSQWVISVVVGNPAITIKGRVTFKGRVTPN